MRILLLQVLLICVSCLSLTAQNLNEKVRGKTNFKEICRIAEEHFQGLRETGRESAPGDWREKHFRRWEWYMRNRLNEDGELCNYKKLVLDARQKMQKSQSSNRSTLSNWTFIGPTDFPANPYYESSVGIGRIDRMAFHPTNPNVIYIGTPSGGVWKTTNGGNDWSSLDNYLPILGVAGLAVGKTNPNLVYVLSGNSFGIGNYPWDSQGVFRSLDGGNTWKRMTMPTANFNAFQLAVSPVDDNHILIATSKALYRSPDGGENWIQVLSDNNVHDVKFKPGTDNTFYACTSTAVKYTTNYGNNWVVSNLDVAPLANGRKVLATTQGSPNVVYVMAGPNIGSGSFAGFYRSTNGGVDFSLRTTSPNIFGVNENNTFNGQPFSCIALAAHPTNPNLIVSGGLVPFRSNNGGSTWTQLNTYFNNGNVEDYIHVDFKDLFFNPINNWLYAANDGGIYRSIDNGTNWENISEGIGVTQFYTVATFQGDHEKVIGGTQDNGAKRKISGTTIWDELGGGDGFITAYDKLNNEQFYFSGNNSLFRRTFDGILETVISITPPVNSNTAHSQVATRYNNANHVYVGTRADTMCFSPFAGNAWTCIPLKSDLAIVNCPTNEDRLYVAGGWFSNPIISRSIDEGANWTRIDSTGGLPDFTGAGFFPTDIAVRQNNEYQLVVTISGFTEGEKVYYSADGGDDFENISANLPNVPTHCAAYLSNGGILVGTDLGVFYKADYNTNWIPFSNNLPQCHVSEMAVNESDGKITISTYGRGAFVTDMPGPSCDPALVWTIPETLNGQHYFEASNYIETRHMITNGSIGTQVFYQSGNFIDFKEGFLARSNNEEIIQGKIAPCGTEIPSFSTPSDGSGSKSKFNQVLESRKN